VSGNHGGQWDAWVVKLSEFGDVQWQNCYGGSRIDERKVFWRIRMGILFSPAEPIPMMGM